MFTRNKKVSIVMPAYNAENTIYDSIKSVVEQTYDDWELIIINDKSSDNTLEKINIFNDIRIKVINNEDNYGVALSRNIGIKLAIGRFIAFLDSDDLWLPRKLEKQIGELLINNNAICSHSGFYRIDIDGDIIGEVKVFNQINHEKQLHGNFIGNLTGVIDMSKIEKKPLQKNIKHEDYLMWFEILNTNKDSFSIGINEPLAKYRVHQSISSNKFKSMYWHWLIIKKEMKLNYFQSMYYFSTYIFHAIKKRY